MKYLAVNPENYINKGENNMAIIVDGIIGAGKSTVATFLSETLDIKLYQEILEDHSESLTQRMLDRFYENQSRWSAITQVMFLNHRFKDLKRIEKEKILDRLEPKTKKYFDKFYICPDCDQIYWQGSHFNKIDKMIEKIKGEIKNGL